MKGVQLSLFGDDAVVPIPECSDIVLRTYGTPERVAQLTVEAARRWRAQHPDKDVFEMLPPSWRAYVRAHL